jgi:predicted RNase H-like HicB family nuclease
MMVDSNGTSQDRAAEARRYALVIEWSDEDQVFIASAPDLPGLRTHGATREEAATMGEEAIALWLGASRRIDRVAPPASFTALPYRVRPEASPHEVAGARRSA